MVQRKDLWSEIESSFQHKRGIFHKQNTPGPLNASRLVHLGLHDATSIVLRQRRLLRSDRGGLQVVGIVVVVGVSGNERSLLSSGTVLEDVTSGEGDEDEAAKEGG